MLIRWGQISLLALLAVFTLFIAGDVRDAASQDDADPSADAAAEGFVEATGRIESAATTDIRSEVPGTHAILEIVADGAEVKAGDLIVQLDDSSLQAELPAHRITLAQARAVRDQAQSRLAALNADAENNRETLLLRLEIAELELKRYTEAALPLEIQRSESRIEIAEQQVAAWSERVEQMESAGQAVARSELDAARIELTEAEANLELARQSLRLLTDYEGRLQTKKLELQVAEARAALQQIDRTSTAARAEAEAGLAAAEVALANAEQQLSTVSEAVERCAIHAPRDGVILHSVPAARRARAQTYSVGTVVREGQVLLQFPDLSRLRARLTVDEEQVAPIRVGQAVSMKIGDSEEQRLGAISEIGEREPTVVFPSGSHQPPRTIFVEFDDPADGLRIGAAIRAMIDVSDADE